MVLIQGSKGSPGRNADIRGESSDSYVSRTVLTKAWIHQPVEDKMQFIHLQLSYLESADADTRRCGVICLSHLVQGLS
jgi:hypothetical protein